MKVISKARVFLWAGGGVSLLYFFTVASILGFHPDFHYFWLLLGVILICGGFFWEKRCRFSRNLKRIGAALLILSCTVFALVEGTIFFTGISEPNPGAEYVIVLGAKVNGTTPSKRLQERIDAAAEYLHENKSAKAIVSGGQGVDEEISEALAMSRGLIAQGIAEDRILMEDQSTSTTENLDFSREFIQDPNAQVVIVSSDFHVFRALELAKHHGYEAVSGLGSRKWDWLTINYYTREFFASFYDFFLRGLLH